MSELNLLDGWFKFPVGDGAFYALFGFLFVFFGISILILLFSLLGKLMNYLKTHPRKPKKTEKTVQDISESESVPEEGVSPEVVAAITAALMAYYEQEQAQCDFIVKRIKRI